ncbi:MAG: hypothetical protein JNN25_11590 [Candidatus Kapabacteria bacterium]|nr:hypothetical protein [Candidatus Kapabacteria bacterium]
MKNTIQNSEKEQWKDHVLSSLEGIRRAEAPPFLFTRIETHIRLHKMPTHIAAHEKVPVLKLAFGVACFVLLCGINVWIVSQTASPNTAQQHQTSSAQGAPVLETADFDLY